MLDFQATDAVGMRVQSVAKIDGLLNVVSAWKGEEMENVFQESQCRDNRRVSITCL